MRLVLVAALSLAVVSPAFAQGERAKTRMHYPTLEKMLRRFARKGERKPGVVVGAGGGSRVRTRG